MGVIDNLGYIKKAAAFPCATPNPILIAQAAGNAIAPVLLNAATFGCNDIVKMRAGISPWHSRGLKALIKGAIPPDETATAGKLLKFTIPVEKALFFWFVVDLTTDFFARWHSQVFRLGACGHPLRSWTGSGPLSTWVMPAPNGWTRISYSMTKNPPGAPNIGSDGFIVTSHQYWQAYFSLTPRPLWVGQVPGSVQLRLHQIAGRPFVIEGPKVPAPWFGNQIHASILFNSDNENIGLKEYVFEASCDTVAIGLSGSASVSISDRPLEVENFLPTNCFGPSPPTL